MKTKYIKFWSLVALISFSLTPLIHAQMGLPLVKNYSPEDYKGGIQNWEIKQDENGLIYVANNFGLLQLDGNDWRVYSINGTSRLRSIAMSEQGRVFAGAQGEFGYYEGDSIGALRYHSLLPLVPAAYNNIGEAWKTYVLDDKVYFCTFTNIYVYDIKNDSIEVITSEFGLDITSKADNKLFTYVPEYGLYRFENHELIALPYAKQLSNKEVSSIINYGDNELLITTYRNGIYKANNSELAPWQPSLNPLFSESFINAAILLSNGNIALGTQHKGIFIISPDGEIILQMDKDSGLLSRTVLSLFEDQNQNLWVGQNNGISFIQLKSPFKVINEEQNLPGTGYSALKKGEDLYLGTNNGVYFKSPSQDYQIITGTEGQVYELQQIEESIYVGHNNGGLKITNNKVFHIGTDRNGTWAYQEVYNHLLKGTYGGIDILDENGTKVLGAIKNLAESSRILVKENDSTLWMSHSYRGIYKISFHEKSVFKHTVTLYNVENGLPSNLKNTVHLIDGQLKISTENGFFTYDHDAETFKSDVLFNTFFMEDQISDLQLDMYGNIYFISDNSVGFLEKKGVSRYEKHSSPFNSIRNLLNDDLTNINIISPSQVLFGAKEGFLLFDRNLYWTTEQEIFRTMIRNVTNIGEQTKVLYQGNLAYDRKLPTLEDDDISKIEYSDNTLTFNFSSTSFSPNFEPEFQFKLLGFDKDWQVWTENNFKEYTNLKEGFYTFQVRSRNANENVSEIESYSFIIIYPWYRSPIAYIIYVIVVTSTILGFLVFLDRGHQKEKRRLEQKRVEQLSEIENELKTFSKNKEAEINALQKEKLEIKIKHINSELASNTMHILNKNDFISGIKSTLGVLEKKSTNSDVKTQITGIIKDIEKNIQKDGDWKNFQIHFEKVHGDFSTRLKNQFKLLSPQEIKLSAYLRLNLSSKEIANLLNISTRGVEIGRYRLRKKLQLDRSQNLAEFILNY